VLKSTVCIVFVSKCKLFSVGDAAVVEACVN